MKKCPKCQHENPDDSAFCGKCTTRLSGEAMPSFTKTLESPVEIPQGTIYAGKYEILEKLGQGGMGIVYRALDKNLGRQVAIKVLPQEFSQDRERMARFEREAKLLAVLNHPNIAVIHGLEESEGRRFLVLELVEGETLATRLGRGSPTVDDALKTCKQIAEGLEAAHLKGIIHRDLKPANIKVTKEGKVKILDFGLAKELFDESTSANLSQSPTITDKLTAPGVILGTASYMSPEQAKGNHVDKQSDIWAFGCILFECLSGRRAFEGKTITETIASIIKGEPSWEKLPAVTPWRIKELVRRCLEKEPRDRLHDIADVRIDIVDAARQPGVPDSGPVRKPIRTWIFLGVVCGLIIGAVAAALITWHLLSLSTADVGHFTLKVEQGFWLDGGRRSDHLERPSQTAIDISSDGSFIVYSAIQENPGPQDRAQIYLRKLDQREATPVEGTEGGINPFLSPDDQWIGFWQDRELKKVRVEGGVAAPLCDSERIFGADWGPDNTIIFSPSWRTGLCRIPDEGGEIEVLTEPDEIKEEFDHRLPHFLPGGRAVLFTVMRHQWDNHPRLELLDLEDRSWSPVMEDAADGQYLPTGHLIFLRQGNLMAVAFDLDRLEPVGQPRPIVENVMQALGITSAINNTAAGQYCVSDSGELVYAVGGMLPPPDRSLVKVDLKGNVESIVDFLDSFDAPRFSPDGEQIAYRTMGSKQELWIYDINRGTKSKLTSDGRASFFAWMPPDGKRLVFEWLKSGPRNLYWQLADGSSPMERLTTSENTQRPGSFSPDGTTLTVVELNPVTGNDIYLLDLESRKMTPFLNTAADEGYPEISPDGRWMAYTTNESGRTEVWVCPFPNPTFREPISTDGGVSPLWSKDGSQLFYRDADEVWVVDIRTESRFSASRPRWLFKRQELIRASPIRGWDILPDGQGFLMVKDDERGIQPVKEMNLIQNWFEELKRLVPVER